MMGSNKVYVDGKGKDQTNKRSIAQVGLSPVVTNAFTARNFISSVVGETDISDVIAVMREKVLAVNGGDLSGVEEMLITQAHALDSIFTEMAKRAALNMGEHLDATQTYMQLALKAQTQCRTTLQTLAEIKNPRPVAFVKQANISNGPQQVNNGTDSTVRAGKTIEPSTNEQSQDSHELLPHTRAPSFAIPTDPQMEAVGKINRPKHGRRKSS